MLRIILLISFLISCSDDFKDKKIYQLSILRKLLSSNSSRSNITTAPTPSPTPDPSLNYKYLFITTTTHNGNFDNDATLAVNGAVNADGNGISEIDQFCRLDKTNNFSTLPGDASEYKALIVDDTNRRACSTTNCSGGSSEHLDWVLKAGTDYYSQSKVKIFTTNSSAGIVNTIDQILDSAGNEYWTGLSVDFRSNVTKCINWNTNSALQNSRKGISNSTSLNFFSNLTANCNSTLRILCVRQ